jgi:hemerythrin-like domain-containing protein
VKEDNTMPDANQLLREDHRKVKELFRQFESATDRRQKKRIALEAIQELDVHTKIEEEIYYPAVRKRDREDAAELVAEAEEEHAVVERLAAQLKRRRSVDDEFEAKFKVMAENVKHHIEEEEMQMLPMAAEEGMDRLRELGEEMQMEKARLMGASRNGSRVPRTSARSTTQRRSAAGSRSTRTPSRAGRSTTTRKTTTRKKATNSSAKARSPSPRKTSSAGRTLARSRGRNQRTGAAGRTIARGRTGTKARSANSTNTTSRGGRRAR